MRLDFLDRFFIPESESRFVLDDLVNSSISINRSMAEENSLFTQLVSYTFILYPEKKKAYIAQRISGDKRLLHSYCLGFGGHVSIEDINGKYSPLSPIYNAAIRELREELVLNKKNIVPKFIGFGRDMHSSTSEHLGAIFILKTGSASIKEVEKLKGLWVTYEDLKNKYYDKLESWSKKTLDYIYEDPILSREYGFLS